MKEKKVSIIIRVKNEENWIDSCLRSVFKQEYNNYEVIIVNNKSEDNTVKKASKFPAKIIQIDDYLPGKAINLGVKSSKGEIIVCLSGHCIPKNSLWLKKLIANLEDDSVAGVYGRQEPMSFSSPFDKRDLMITFGLDKKIQYKDYFFHNANSAFKKEIWKKFPFNEKINNIEDRVWAKEVINSNYKLIYEPDASVYHYHGIHHNLNLERAQNIVKIMEGIEVEENKKIKKLENLKIASIVPFKGKQISKESLNLLKYTIEDAGNMYKQDIFITTDNKDLKNLLKNEKIKEIFIRPKYLSENYISIIEVIQHTLDEIEKKHYLPDLLIIMDPSQPFRSKTIVLDMIKKLINKGADSIIAVQSEHRNIWEVTGENNITILEENFIPRQFKEKKSYISLFGLCFITFSKFIKDLSIYGKHIETFEIHSPLSSIQLRNEEDIRKSEKILEYWHKNRD